MQEGKDVCFSDGYKEKSRKWLNDTSITICYCFFRVFIVYEFDILCIRLGYESIEKKHNDSIIQYQNIIYNFLNGK